MKSINPSEPSHLISLHIGLHPHSNNGGMGLGKFNPGLRNKKKLNFNPIKNRVPSFMKNLKPPSARKTTKLNSKSTRDENEKSMGMDDYNYPDLNLD
jgi:hypothetical protein